MSFVLSTLLSQIPGISHGFGTALEPIPDPLKNWERAAPRWKQVHGISLAEVTGPQQELGDVDAVFTSHFEIPIAVRTADCVPILLARKDGQRVAAIHSGWRGCEARIVRHLWDGLNKTQEEEPSQWVAAIGPCIGPDAFEVSEEIYNRFLEVFEAYPRDEIAPSFRHLNLQKIVEQELRQVGLTAIDVISMCTFTERKDGKPLFYSHRRDQSLERQYSVIEICS